MIQDFFQLQRQPFLSVPTPEQYFPASSIEAARCSLVRLVERNEGPGLVIGSVIYSLPFVVQPLQNAFTSVGRRPLEVAATLRASPLDRFFSVAVPLARPGFLTAAVLGFAHSLGEFGVVLMIGGNIPGKTQVLSIAIYDHVEALEYAHAHLLAGGLLALSFILLIVIYALNRRFSVVQP